MANRYLAAVDLDCCAEAFEPEEGLHGNEALNLYSKIMAMMQTGTTPRNRISRLFAKVVKP